MNLHVTVAGVLALFASNCALALTIEPLPGTTPQTTGAGAFYPVDVGVIVRDDGGQPAAGVPVTFSLPFDAVASFPDSGGNVFTRLTDADGVAIPFPGLVGFSAGAVVLTASTPEAAEPAVFDLTVTGVLPTSMATLSGESQWTYTGTLFPDRFIVQTFGANRTPLPHAAILFFLRPDAVPSGLFEGGANVLYVKADAGGVAVAPPVTANLVEGHGVASALAFSETDNRDNAVGQLFKYKLVAPR